MAEVIKKVKGFVNKKGDKFELEPSTHTHTCSEILGLDDKIQEYDSDIADIQSSLGNFALKEHSHDSILDADTDSSVSISEGVLNISLHDPYTESGGETDITVDNIGNLNRALKDPSTTPENDDNKLITSKAVYDALNEKMSNKTIDSAPANNANNLISSKAVYDAISGINLRYLCFIAPSGGSTSDYRIVDWVDFYHKVFDYVLESPIGVTLTVYAGCYTQGGPGEEDIDTGEVSITKKFSYQHGDRVSWNIYDELISAGDAEYGNVDYVKDITIRVQTTTPQQDATTVIMSVLPHIS